MLLHPRVLLVALVQGWPCHLRVPGRNYSRCRSRMSAHPASGLLFCARMRPCFATPNELAADEEEVSLWRSSSLPLPGLAESHRFLLFT